MNSYALIYNNLYCIFIQSSMYNNCNLSVQQSTVILVHVIHMSKWLTDIAI